MTFLPIVDRELRVASRKRMTYWARSGAVLLAVIISAWMFPMLWRQPARETGKFLFIVLASFSFLYCLLSGTRVTADCLSEEKRSGTLGLLFLTDLRGFDIVLGKLAATSIGSLYNLIAIFPVMAVPLMLGGVSATEFWKVILVLVNTMFFSLTTGIFVSSISVDGRRAMGGTFILLVLFLAGLPAIGGAIAMYYETNQVNPWFLIPSPGFAYQTAAFSFVPTGLSMHFWKSVAFVHVVGWAFLGLACYCAPRTWQDRPATANRMKLRDRIKQASYGTENVRAAFRQRLLNINPFYWLAGRDRLKPAYVWLALGLGLCGWVWGYFELRDDWLSEPVYVCTALFVTVLVKLWITAESGRRIGEERAAGSLELLLSTPISIPEIIRGHSLALQRQFLGPSVLVVAINLVLLGVMMRVTTGQRDMWMWMWLAWIAMFIADVIAIHWVGMWVGLTAKKVNRISGVTGARILATPWFIFWGCCMVMAMYDALVGNISVDEEFMLGLWFVIGIANDILQSIRARRRLLEDFRAVAMERYIPGGKRKWWFFGPNEEAPNVPPVISP